MIYFYKHKTLNDLSENEINFLGYNGVEKYASMTGRDPKELYAQILKLEAEIQKVKDNPKIIDSPNFNFLFEKSIDEYIKYFNKGASYNKQAYFVIGNIASGKSKYARQLETETQSIIVDSDRIKMGENTNIGFYEGISSLYSPENRDYLQVKGSKAIAKVIENISLTGMNLVLPTAPTSFEILENKAKKLYEKGYDIHLILMEVPITECANRNYLRFLKKEFSNELDPNGNPIRGRFVQRSVLINRADSCYSTFCNAYSSKRYKSYKAIYNDSEKRDELDLESMQPLQ